MLIMNPMLGVVGSIMPKTPQDLQASRKLLEKATSIEFRLDLLRKNIHDSQVAEALMSAVPDIDHSKPVILTLRSSEQGGPEKITLEEQWGFWQNLHPMLRKRIESPELPIYVDLGYDLIDFGRDKKLPDLFPWMKVGASWHFMDKTPDYASLHEKLSSLQGTKARAFIKLITMAQKSSDVTLVIALFAGRNGGVPLVSFAMGEAGEKSRRECMLWGSTGTYGYVLGFGTTAPGQLSIDELLADPHVSSALRERAKYSKH